MSALSLLVQPFDAATLPLIAAFVYFVTDRVKERVPEGPNQNLLVRVFAIVAGAVAALAIVPLTPDFVASYREFLSAAVQGGATGFAVSIAVMTAYAVKSSSTPSAPSSPAAPATPTSSTSA